LDSLFTVQLRANTAKIRKVYAVYRDKGANYDITWFLIYENQWLWVDSAAYAPN